MTEKEKQVQCALGLLNRYRVSLFDPTSIPHDPPLHGDGQKFLVIRTYGQKNIIKFVRRRIAKLRADNVLK